MNAATSGGGGSNSNDSGSGSGGATAAAIANGAAGRPDAATGGSSDSGAAVSPVIRSLPPENDPPASFFAATRRVLTFIRFSHTVFALPFALGSMLVAAHGWPAWDGRAHRAGDGLRADRGDDFQPAGRLGDSTSAIRAPPAGIGSCRGPWRRRCSSLVPARSSPRRRGSIRSASRFRRSRCVIVFFYSLTKRFTDR